MIVCYTQSDGDDGWLVVEDGKIVSDIDAKLSWFDKISNNLPSGKGPCVIKRSGKTLVGVVTCDLLSAQGRYKRMGFMADIQDITRNGHELMIASIEMLGLRMSSDLKNLLIKKLSIVARRRMLLTSICLTIVAFVFVIVLYLLFKDLNYYKEDYYGKECSQRNCCCF